jgi:hypothetical protein
MGAEERSLVPMKDHERAKRFLEPILADGASCGDEENDAELVQVLADQFAEVRRQTQESFIAGPLPPAVVTRLREVATEFLTQPRKDLKECQRDLSALLQGTYSAALQQRFSVDGS